jgi:hypothetical protein
MEHHKGLSAKPGAIYADTTIVWTPERVDAWVKERLAGVQYATGHGTVYVPKPNQE